jgi:multidrug efflux system outer membrane protein
MHKTLKIVMVISLALLASGCALAPEYHRPVAPVGVAFEQGKTTPLESSSTDLLVDELVEIGWRDVFIDLELQQLISTALLNNRNLRQSALSVAGFQAQYRIQRSALLPNIDATGYGLKESIPTNGSHVTSEKYSLGVGITSWELDFFGRLQSLKSRALEQYLAMEETHKSVQISLVADVVNGYLNLLADRELYKISEETKKIEAESYKLIEYRVNAGISDRLDLAQARTSLESVKVNLIRYQRLVSQDIHYLSLLSGKQLSTEMIKGDKLLTDVRPVTVLPASLDSSVLLRRPDIMAAEHELIGANANIGAARAAFFPRISLTASTGFLSADLSNLIQSDSSTWGFAPTIAVPIFNGGRLKAELDVAKIQKDSSIAAYEYAIQTAFREVSDTLVGYETYAEQLKAQKANLDANEEYYSHARNRYEEGVDSFLTLLDAQRSLYSARQAYLSLQLDDLVNRVNLYKVLGGGWKETSNR